MKQQKLEEQQWNIETELRHLMNKPGKDQLDRESCWPLGVWSPQLCTPALGCPSDLNDTARDHSFTGGSLLTAALLSCQVQTPCNIQPTRAF